MVDPNASAMHLLSAAAAAPATAVVVVALIHAEAKENKQLNLTYDK